MARDWCFLTVCLSLVSFGLGLLVVFLVILSLYAYPSSPSVSIDLFDNQAINMTRADDSPKSLIINFHLKIRNKNSAIGLHYPGPIKITFSYFPNVSMMVPLAEYTVDSFYQGNGKTKHVRDSVETNGVPTVLEGTDMVVFRVDLVGTYRNKKVRSKRQYKVDVGCVVFVDYNTSQKMRTGFIWLERGLYGWFSQVWILSWNLRLDE